MENERSIDKLARYIMYLFIVVVIAVLCREFQNILIFIFAAAVVALVGRPLMILGRKVKIKGKIAPDWLLAMITLVLLLGIFIGVITVIFPIFFSIIRNISSDLQLAQRNVSALSMQFAKWNESLRTTFPQLGEDFTIQGYLTSTLTNAFSVGSITSALGSIAATIGSIGIAIFSIVFIGFFFLKDENLFRNIIKALVPDRLEERTAEALGDIEILLSRYFVGLIIEVTCVATLNFIGLSTIARIGFTASVGIAFLTGIMNIIPYVGPWIGAAIGTVLGVILKYSTAFAAGTPTNLGTFIVIILAVFVFTQMVDNFVLQPLIYSTSIKSSPLEIFIVLLLAGHIGGVLGMLVAIPVYTVIRVIAAEFFHHVKVIRRLIPHEDDVKVKKH